MPSIGKWTAGVHHVNATARTSRGTYLTRDSHGSANHRIIDGTRQRNKSTADRYVYWRILAAVTASMPVFLLTNTRRGSDDALPYTRHRNDMERVLSRQNEPVCRNSIDPHRRYQFPDVRNVVFSRYDAHYSCVLRCIERVKRTKEENV